MMLKKITLIENTLEPENNKIFYVNDVRDFIMSRYVTLPPTLRIYHGDICDLNDVTPFDEGSLERLAGLQGEFHVVVFAGEAITVIAVVAVISLLIGVASFFLAPSPPTSTQRNTQTASPNNDLSERENRPRPNARIPDIFGTVRCTPDLLSPTYSVFQNNQEREHAYMCIGRGEYAITDIRDDTTLIDDIDGAYVAIFAPDTSPNSADLPQLQAGNPPDILTIRGTGDIKFTYPNLIELDVSSTIDFTDYFADGDKIVIAESNTVFKDISDNEKSLNFNGTYVITTVTSDTITLDSPEDIRDSWLDLDDYPLQVNTGTEYYRDTKPLLKQVSVIQTLVNAERITGVNGQEMVSPNGGGVRGKVRFMPPNIMEAQSGSGVDFTEFFKVGDTVILENASGTSMLGDYDISDTYEIATLTDSEMTFVDVSHVADWSIIVALGGTSYFSDDKPLCYVAGDKNIGWFVLKDIDKIYCNFLALNGLYKDNGSVQTAFDAEIEVEVEPIDENDEPIDDSEIFTATLTGSRVDRSTRAVTLKIDPTFSGRCRVRARRITDTDYDYEGTVVDEVKWRDLYAVKDVTETDFGDVTTVQSVTLATESALAVKNRKLNMLVTRKIPIRTTGTSFTSTLHFTNRIDEILSFICLDPYIGNRDVSEIDLDSVYDTVAEVETYFGTEKAVEFNYTFDKDNLSFEETVAILANTIFCTAYRQSGKIKLSFEKETADSVLLFNHRNKIPSSEERSVKFGKNNEHDGVELQYVSDTDDALVTFYIPSDQTARNPKKIETIGIRNKIQAYFTAWRQYNKIIYQNIITEFEALQEAELLVIKDRILVADNTRSGTQDGEVVSVSGLTLTLSQPITFNALKTYMIFLQHYDSTVESIAITEGATPYQVILDDAPSLSLVTDPNNYARTVFWVVADDDMREQAFLVTEKSPQDNFTCKIQAINYDSRYYSKDKDYIDEIIDENGNII